MRASTKFEGHFFFSPVEQRVGSSDRLSVYMGLVENSVVVSVVGVLITVIQLF